MRKTVLVLIIALIALAAWQYKLQKTANQQLLIAEQRVKDVVSAGTNDLDF